MDKSIVPFVKELLLWVLKHPEQSKYVSSVRVEISSVGKLLPLQSSFFSLGLLLTSKLLRLLLLQYKNSNSVRLVKSNAVRELLEQLKSVSLENLEQSISVN